MRVSLVEWRWWSPKTFFVLNTLPIFWEYYFATCLQFYLTERSDKRHSAPFLKWQKKKISLLVAHKTVCISNTLIHYFDVYLIMDVNDKALNLIKIQPKRNSYTRAILIQCLLTFDDVVSLYKRTIFRRSFGCPFVIYGLLVRLLQQASRNQLKNC